MRDLIINIGHTAIAKVVLMAVQFAVATILARNLSAEDYGVVGFANVLMALLLRLKGMGLAQAVVRSPHLEERTLNTAATLNVVFSVLAFLVAQASAPLVGQLLDSPASVPVVRVLAFGFLLGPLGFLPSCLLTREMKFGILRTPAVAGAVVRGVVAVTLAVKGWKFWSLVVGDLVGTLTNNGLLQLLRRSRFKWKLEREEIKILLGYGVPLTLASLVTFVALNVDSFAIGSLLGAQQLGFYTVAFTWATFVSTSLQEVVHSVLFPKFSHIQTDTTRLREAYLRTVAVIGFGAAMVNGALLVVADGFLYHVLGKGTDRWLPATEALRILCIYGISRSVVETVGNPLMALGETRLLLKANSLAAIIQSGLIYFVIRFFGIEGVSVLVTVAYSSQCAVYLPFVLRRLNIAPKELLRVVSPSAVAWLGGATVAMALMGMQPGSLENMVLRISLYVLAFVAIHEIVSQGRILKEARNVWVALLLTKNQTDKACNP